MFGLKIKINGDVVSVMGAEKADSLHITVVAHPQRDGSALLYTNGSVAETAEYRTDREWIEPRKLATGDAVTVEVVDVAAVDPGTITSERGRKVAGERAELFCSWCGKSEHAARKLVAGPQVCICDECTKLVSEIINESAT